MKIKDCCLVIVDFQNDFCIGGSIPICEPQLLAPKINELINYFKVNNEIVLASQDWHPQNHISFSVNREMYKDLIKKENIKLFPLHCLQNSQGAEINNYLNANLIDEFFRKGINPLIEQFSAFNALAINHNNLTMHEYIFNKGIKSVFVCGLALDCSVIKTALDFHNAGFEACVISDASFPLNNENNETIKQQCLKIGIKLITSQEIIQEKGNK